MLEKEIENSAHSKLVSSCQKYEETMTGLLSRQESLSKSRAKIESNFITPEFDKKVFILDNYTHLKGKHDVLYS